MLRDPAWSNWVKRCGGGCDRSLLEAKGRIDKACEAYHVDVLSGPNRRFSDPRPFVGPCQEFQRQEF